MSKEKLKPCPFCGGEAEMYYILDVQFSTQKTPALSCKECSVEFTYNVLEEEACRKWNKRVVDFSENLTKENMKMLDVFDKIKNKEMALSVLDAILVYGKD